MVTHDIVRKGAWQIVSAMLRQISMTLQTEILLTEFLDAFQTNIFLKSFNLVFDTKYLDTQIRSPKGSVTKCSQVVSIIYLQPYVCIGVTDQ